MLAASDLYCVPRPTIVLRGHQLPRRSRRRTRKTMQALHRVPREHQRITPGINVGNAEVPAISGIIVRLQKRD